MLGEYFKTEAGLRLLARTLTAGRNWYGSMVDQSDESLADFSAHLLELFKEDCLGYKQKRGNDDFMLGRPYSRDTEDTWKSYAGMVPILKKLSKGGDASRFLETATPICEQRRMFLTINSFLGMGPDCVREGDLVFVLSGRDLPFILRPVEPKTNTRSDTVIEIPGARPLAEK
jgi:hypothetical protein